MDIQYSRLSEQTQTQDKMQEMLADRLMYKQNEKFLDITADDPFLTQDIIQLLCSNDFGADSEFWNMRDSIFSRFITALGHNYEFYCRELVLDDLAAEEQYQKDAAVDMEIEQRRLG